MLVPAANVATLIVAIATALEKAVPAFRLQEDSPETRSMEKAHKREIELLQAQAKAAQEVAIAERIRTAETVTIEEFFDLSGKANLGAKAQEGAATLGLSATGQRVQRRVITFAGTRTEQAPKELPSTEAKETAHNISKTKKWWPLS